MTVEQMRNALSQVYSGPTWRLRVNGMDDRQVVAIYRCMQAEGRLHPHKRKRKEPGIKRCEQITIWDILDKGDADAG